MEGDRHSPAPEASRRNILVGPGCALLAVAAVAWVAWIVLPLPWILPRWVLWLLALVGVVPGCLMVTLGEALAGRDRWPGALLRGLATGALTLCVPLVHLALVGPIVGLLEVAVLVGAMALVVHVRFRRTRPETGGSSRYGGLEDPELQEALEAQARRLGVRLTGIRVDPTGWGLRLDLVGGATPVLVLGQELLQKSTTSTLTALLALELERRRWRGPVVLGLWCNLVMATGSALTLLQAFGPAPLLGTLTAVVVWAYLTPPLSWLWVRLEDRRLRGRVDPEGVRAALRLLHPHPAPGGALFTILWWPHVVRPGREARICQEELPGASPSRLHLVLAALGALLTVALIILAPSLDWTGMLQQQRSLLLPLLVAVPVGIGLVRRTVHRRQAPGEWPVLRSLLLTPPWWCAYLYALWLACQDLQQVPALSWVVLLMLVLAGGVAWLLVPLWDRISDQPY